MFFGCLPCCGGGGSVSGTCALPQPDYETEIKLSVNEVETVRRFASPQFGCLNNKQLLELVTCSDDDLISSVPSFEFLFTDWSRCTLANQGECGDSPGIIADNPKIYFGLSAEEFDSPERTENWVAGGYAAAGRLGISCGSSDSSRALLDVDIYSDLYPVPSCYRTGDIAFYGFTSLGVFYDVRADSSYSSSKAAEILSGGTVGARLTVRCNLLLEDTSKQTGDECRIFYKTSFSVTTLGAYFSEHNPLP